MKRRGVRRNDLIGELRSCPAESPVANGPHLMVLDPQDNKGRRIAFKIKAKLET